MIQELKSEIQKLPDEAPEFVLQDVLRLLKEKQSEPVEKMIL